MKKYDLIVVGGGIAGLSAALHATELGLSTVILDKSGPQHLGAATHYAQGGLAVTGLSDAPDGIDRSPDSVELHADDTMKAGAHHNNPAVVTSIISGAATAVHWLINHGANFDRTSSGKRYRRTLEGGHSRRRIVHANGDGTGAEIERALNAATAHIETISCTALAIDDLKVITNKGNVYGTNVAVATGGCGQLFAATTAPKGATGSGMTLALDAGASVRDMEFIQFHPTVLDRAGSFGQKVLLSEALRGEGARIVNKHGEAVTDNDLAPRDIVARAVAAVGEAYLDARDVPNVRERFPQVTKAVTEFGLDPATDLLPIAPAAHYTCGGVATDVHGRTAVPGLYAVGECAGTGLHGANRLASNSLLEGLVVGRRVAQDVAGKGRAQHLREVCCSNGANRVHTLRPMLTEAQLRQLQQAMSAGAGIVRTAAGLQRTMDVLSELPAAAEVVVAREVVSAALARTETLGCHTRAD